VEKTPPARSAGSERAAGETVHAAPVPDDPALQTPTAEQDAAETGPAETGPAETGPAETGPAETGPAEESPSGTGPVDPIAAPPAAAVSGGRGLLPLVLVGLLTLAMIAGVAFLGLRLRSQSQADTAREQALVASRDAARVLFSYDHATLDADFERGLSVTTGPFKDEYARTTQEVVKGVATQYKAVVVADVVESAVVGASPREVTTVVFLNQATTSTQVEGRKIDQSRVRMTLVKVDGRWLVSKVDAL
jgi:Mce-associated membrane protein